MSLPVLLAEEAPVAIATRVPTPEPTEEPTPEPTADPNDVYFLDGDGEEYELDFEKGHWWYKNDSLAIDVLEVHTTFKDEKNKTVPLVYYVADIRMRNYSSYRSGVHGGFEPPWKYARIEKAVLGITGDNLDRDEKELKGCLLRKGKLYWNAKKETLVIEGGMSMYVLPAGEASERVLMDHGVRDTYGFGPILVRDGVVNKGVSKNRVNHANPRCGIGMIEPGHWIAIATDGRQLNYSHSITLEYFAQMFVDYGCTVAYNMDGGASVGIVFMGEALNRHIKQLPDEQRPWNDALLFGYSENVPSPNEKTIHNGYHH